MSFDTRQYCIDNKLASFSLNLSWDGKKKEPEPISWSKITIDNFAKYHDKKKTGFAILTGTLNNIVVIDCDIAKAEGQFPQDILDTCEKYCKSIVKTPNGKHFYFRCTKKIPKRTGSYWKGIKIQFLDILAEKSFIFAPPSHYTKGDAIVGYSWCLGDLSTLVDLPLEIEDAIQEPEKITLATESTTDDNIESILNALSVERWSNYEDWLKIGIVLYNSGYSVQLWDTYSKKATNYDSRACFLKWKTFHQNKDGLGIGTLYWFLKEDDPAFFNTLRDSIENIYLRCANITNQNTATIFYLTNPYKYVFSPQLGWYSLQENNVWAFSEDKPEKIMTSISNTVSSLCESARDYFLDKAKKEEDEERRKNITIMAVNCIKHKKSVQGTAYCKSTIEWIKELYTDNNFHKKLNANRNLLAFEDAVFDFSKGEFRKIEATDYISITCPFPAPSLDSPIDPRLNNFLQSIFECEEDLQYLLQILAYSLDGLNRFQEVYLFIGSGGNSKGLIQNLIQRCLGDYYYTLPKSYITQATEVKGTAVPELADCAFIRFLTSTEPESTEKLQIAFLNKLSGNECFNVRKLYGKPFTYLPQFTVFILCNGVKLSRAHDSIQRRLVVVNFPLQFKKPQDFNPSNPLHRKANSDLDTILKETTVLQSFMAVLLNTYKKYNLFTAKNIVRPQRVLEATAEFMNENNPLSTWIYDKYDTKADFSKKISFTEIFNHYKQDTGRECSIVQFSGYLSLLGIVVKRETKGKFLMGIERKPEIVS